MENKYGWQRVLNFALAGVFTVLAGCTAEPIGSSSSSSVSSATVVSSSSISSVVASSSAQPIPEVEPRPVVSSSASSFLPAENRIDAAPVTMARLNKTQYNNTVRDLLGTALQPANSFPGDDIQLFDNNADALTISTGHIAGYYTAAIALAREAVEAAQQGARGVINCDMAAANCAQTVIQEFGLKAWRRPLIGAESDRLLAFYEETLASSSDPAVAMQALIRRILFSPNFIFRPEIDQDLDTIAASKLGDYELASRLSYFLWNSMPDDALFETARFGILSGDEEALRSEVERMLNSEKANALVNNFAGQWLGFGREPVLIGVGGDALAESRAFIHYVIQNNRPVSDIVTAGYTFLNNALASYYDVSIVGDEVVQLYPWSSDAQRRGIFGHASVLNAMSSGADTDPWERSVWVLSRLKCQDPARDLIGYGNSHPVVDVVPQPGLNPREKSEWYQSQSSNCSTCHSKFEPVGYALENFDYLGRWRDTYQFGGTVNAYGELPTGQSFFGLVELSAVLAEGPELALCAIQYGMSYALGRELNTFGFSPQQISEASDYNAVYSVFKNTQNSGHSLRDIIIEIALSPVFHSRRGADSVIGDTQ